MFVKINECVMC